MRDATKINEYFYGDKTLFIIPLYQRKYAWERKHCERLFADLEKIHKHNVYSHFFGSIVSIRASETEDDLLIIDGQQRITTISLIVLAAINAVENGDMECVDEDIDNIKKNYLFARKRKVERRIKLRPIERDMLAYDALFYNNPEDFISPEESGITRNYLLFYQLVKLSDLTFDELIESIEKLIVIDIRLDSKDNPQLIFESLNSCGKDLEEADKVRNYLLMSLSAQEQEDYYKKYWSKIEACTDDEPTMFIRDYLTIKRGEISNITELYFDFKKYVEEIRISRQELLAEMLDYAKLYQCVIKGKTESADVNRKLIQLNNVGSTVGMPFYMAFLHYAKNNGLDNKEIYNVFDVVENYWARRIICAYPANVMSKMFAMLHSDICRIIRNHEKRNVALDVSYSELLKYVLLKKQGNAKFPSDSQVDEMFKTRQVYKIPVDYRCFLFERMENENSHELNTTIVSQMKENKISIEHIMPQTLTTQWKEDLGNKWEEIHDTYLHTFANLTLTGYNSSYGNHTFQEKKIGYVDKKGNKVYGFNDSAFRLSNYLKRCEKWTLTELNERQQILLGNFKSLWPMISTEYIPLDKESEMVSFSDDEYEMTNRSILAFHYKSVRYPVQSWKEMLVQLCKLIYKENPTGILYLSTKNSNLHCKERSDLSKVEDNCYVYTSCSTKTKLSVLNYIFENLELSSSDLEFELVPHSEK